MARYKHDFSGVRRLAVGAEMHKMLIDKCFDAIPFAQSISPDAPPYGEGYIDSFEVDGSHTVRTNGVRRAAVHLRNTAEHAWFVENGIDGTGSQNMGHHVLARTADHIERS